jgi:Carboxypeptidase regulatory-like domain
MRSADCFGILLGFAVLGAVAQQSPTVQTAPVNQPSQTGPTGSVTGTVIAQDTQKPIRFAQVQLQSVASVAGSASGRAFGGLGGGAARTEADGTFLATNLAPGDYYVTASALGYIPMRSVLQAAVNNGSDPAQLLASLPVVHVDAEGSSNANITLQRGGTLAGRVVWEDGSAAAGVTVNAISATQQSTQLPAPLSGLQLGGFGQLTMTDDRGDFRISSLPSGDYLLQAAIQSRPQFGGQFAGRGPQTVSTLHVYAPGAFRKSAAKSYSVRVGDERTDVRLTIDLHSLRIVSGHATSSNGSQNVASGRVSVTDASDSSLVLQGAIDPEGNFIVRYVPPGNYTLAISGASTQASGGFRGRGGDSSSTPAISFQPFSQPIVVTDADLSGFAATLTPVQTQTQ